MACVQRFTWETASQNRLRYVVEEPGNRKQPSLGNGHHLLQRQESIAFYVKMEQFTKARQGRGWES